MFEQSIVKFINRNSQALNFSFSENDREKAWLQVNNSQQYSNDAACWNAFLNLLSQNIVSTWLKNELDLFQPIILSSPDIWEFFNGTSFSIGDKRIVIIPNEAIDNQELSVPQEWVDIPKFVADYYLAVQIIPDELSLSIWGFTTHIELKTQGEYDAIERTYSLLSDDLIPDINTFIVSLELCPQQREVIKTLPRISTNEAEDFIQQLSKPSAYLPRLDINFFKWGALLENDVWRQKLYKNRLIPVIPLSSWRRDIENIFDAGWQTLEELFAAPKVNLAFRTIRKIPNKQPDANTLKQIKELIEKIKSTVDEGEKQIAAERLGKIGYQDKEIIDTLIYLIQTTKKEETRWTAAESLWMIDPKNSTVGVKRGIDLGMQLAGYPFRQAPQPEQPQITRFVDELELDDSTGGIDPHEDEFSEPEVKVGSSTYKPSKHEIAEVCTELRRLRINPEPCLGVVKKYWANVPEAIAYLKEALQTWQSVNSPTGVSITACKEGKKPQNTATADVIAWYEWAKSKRIVAAMSGKVVYTPSGEPVDLQQMMRRFPVGK